MIGIAQNVVDGFYRINRHYHAERDNVVPSATSSQLHWLDVADRVTYMYKLGWMVYKCLHGQAPDYLSEL